jgi:SRSO17 transposase
LSTIGKKSFENMGRLIHRSGDTVYRLLHPAEMSFRQAQSIAQSIFAAKKTLYVGIDDTLIKKIHSKMMRGAGMFFDTKIGRCIMAFRLVIGVVTDGKFAIPIDCAYMFAKELLDLIDQKFPTKDEIAKSVVETAIKIFPGIKLIVVVDGLYTSVEFVGWCKRKNIRLEARMHSNRVVKYKGERVKIRDFLQMNGFQPKGRQMARTISVIWHEIDLELTIVRRIDKHDKESIVFQVATYKALPREHVASYSKRWSVEMINRTTKQELGLQECFSRKLETQHNHVAAVLLSYALAQLEMKFCKFDKPEQAIRRCKTKNVDFLERHFTRILNDKVEIYA